MATGSCVTYSRNAGILPQKARALSFLSFSNPLCFTAFPFIFYFLECQNYKNLTSADRNVNYGKRGVECDADIVPGWFRFQGEAGILMATTCPPHWSCNSSGNGWMKGELPSVADGRVTRMACFHVSNRCCFSFKYIQVRNCGE